MTNFGKRIPTSAPSQSLSGNVLTKLAGIDQVTPMEELRDGRTPFAKNFRLYEPTKSGREVAVSSRKGSKAYVPALNEFLNATAWDNPDITVQLNVGTFIATPITVTSNGCINKIAIMLEKLTGKGILRLDLYSSSSGNPDKLIGETSISQINSGISMHYADFVSSPKVSAGDVLYLVIYPQDDSEGTFGIRAKDAVSSSKESNSGIVGLVQKDYGVHFSLYSAPEQLVKGAYRFNQQNGSNKTVYCLDDKLYSVDSNSNRSSIDLSVGNSEHISFDTADNKLFFANGSDGIRYWDGVATTSVKIPDTELGNPKQIAFHKGRLFALEGTNKLKFSEVMGNPSNLPANEQWYNAWLSISDIDVPRPGSNSPTTGMVSFQDSLVIFTQDGKYVLYGSDRGNFYLRESSGKMGALSPRSITRNSEKDPNYIYFVSQDGIYRFDGNKDTKVSKLIQPLFDACPNKQDITPVYWKGQLRCYMASRFSDHNDICAILDTETGEWMLDTGVHVDRAIVQKDADDNNELIEFASCTGAVYEGESSFSSLGAPIDFEYRLKYNSFDTPAQRKKIKRFFPLVQSIDGSFNIKHEVDKDIADAPREKLEMLEDGGYDIGEFSLGTGVTLGGKTRYKPKKISISGYGRLFQYRVSRKGVNNQVAFMGVQLTYKKRRL